MALPDRDVERLDHALDAHQHGREENQSGADEDLLYTFTRLEAMNRRVETDATLKSELWRSMMSAIPLSPALQPTGSNRFAGLGKYNIPFIGHRERRARRRTFLESAVLVALLVALTIGALGYRQFDNGNDGPTIPAPAATQLNYEGPNVAECKAVARDPGTVAALAGQQPTGTAAFPRYGTDPAFGNINAPNFGKNTVDGGVLLTQTQDISTPDPGVFELLSQSVDCEPYLLQNSSGFNLDGRYLSLYTDDFFRRELSGYKEAGKEIKSVRVWTPNSQPDVVDVRAYGDRVMVILSPTARGYYPVLLLAKVGDDWRIDELADAEMPEDWIAQIATSATAIASPFPGTHYTEPLEVDITLFDRESASTPPAYLNDATALCGDRPAENDVPCGWYYVKMGPWDYNEYPAGTDFTFALSNISSESRRFEVEALGVSVEIGPNQTRVIVLNAEPGSYLFEIYASAETTPLAGGVLTFIGPDGSYTRG